MPSPAAGFFGKLPSAGDFVQRRLPAGFVDAWDRHFENAVAESRAALGDSWREAYHASPVWRFVLAPGVCGGSAWAGVMGPGADRVGRCFPMVIAAPVGADAGSFARVLHDGCRWFDAAERVHGAAQGDAAISVDAFDEQVAALAGPLDGALPPSPELLHGVDWSSASHWRLPLPAQPAAAPFLGELWARLAATSGSWCLWWTTGVGRVPASVLVTNGLPQPPAYTGFLDAGHAGPWQSLGRFDDTVPRQPDLREAVAPSLALTSAAAPATWLPDDLELLAGLGIASEPSAGSPPQADTPISEVSTPEHAGGVGVLHRADEALTLVAAEAGRYEPRQRAVAGVLAIARSVAAAELDAGMQALRTRILALSPQLHQASEDLIDPVLEDCAVIAAHVSGGQADMLRIGAAAAWHWRHGRLQPFFAESAPVPVAAGNDDDFDALLFSNVSLAPPGLGATAQPACDEVGCAVEAGDRLLLVATARLAQLPPEILAGSLALPSCDEARLRIATAAGLGADPAQWPLAIIEIDA